MKSKPFISEQLYSIVAIIFVALALFIANNGISIGYSKQINLPLHIYRLQDPAFLPGYLGIESRFYAEYWFTRCFWLFVKTLGEHNAFVYLTIFSNLFFSFSLYRLMKTLRIEIPAFIFIGFLLAFKTFNIGESIEANNITGETFFAVSNLAYSLTFISLSYILQGELYKSIAITGLNSIFHLHVGPYFFLITILTYLLTSEKTKMKNTIKLVFFYVLLASPALYPLSKMIGSGVMGKWAYESYLFRLDQHATFESYKLFSFLGYFILLLLVVFQKNAKPSDEKRIFIIMSGIILLLVVIHFMDYYFFKTTYILKLYFPRFTSYISFFAVILTCKEIQIRKLKFNKPLYAFATFLILITSPKTERFLHSAKQNEFVHYHGKERSDWADVCSWIKNNLPQEGLYLSPPGNVGFPYLTLRAEFFEFKMNPLDGRFIPEWENRLSLITGKPLRELFQIKVPFYDRKKMLNRLYYNLSDDNIIEIKNQYPIHYAIVSKTKKTSFPIVYANKTFKIMML